jgi:ppGpp synthetase/RelA/SpoT-type nucleotidyltranferase
MDKLGERLRRQLTPGQGELELLQGVRAEYEPAMLETQEVLRELGLQSTARLKTVNTIVEKLKRDKTRLSAMQDIAGVRVVLAVSLQEQDAVSATIAGRFPGAKIVDRRA